MIWDLAHNTNTPVPNDFLLENVVYILLFVYTSYVFFSQTEQLNFMHRNLFILITLHSIFPMSRYVFEQSRLQLCYAID